MSAGDAGSGTAARRPARGWGGAAAASALLDRAPPEGYLAEWTEQVARGSTFASASIASLRAREATDAALLSFMVFRLGAEWLALPTEFLLEVTHPRPVHSLPHRRGGVVRGITNVSGELLICVSVGALLGAEQEGGTRQERPAAARPRFLVIGHPSGRFVFPVDEVHGIERRLADALRPSPDTVSRAVPSYTRRVMSWDGRSVACLDGGLLLDGLNRSVA